MEETHEGDCGVNERSLVEIRRAAEQLATACSKRFEYQTQYAAALRLYQVLEYISSKAGVEDVFSSLLAEVQRLHINVSCRIAQRHPELYKIRADVGALRRSIKTKMSALGIALDAPSPGAKSPGFPPAWPAEEAWPDDLATLRGRCTEFRERGPRHLCPHLCYYREYEPARRLHSLRMRCANAGLEHRYAARPGAFPEEPAVCNLICPVADEAEEC
ncbi:hypothetical protein CYMTET_32818 [Cymbomonas tetramitiformis]|uniref:Uncharacterized protein n=1 Tax=Cymbomonas tetramitiformis TaxID=36881 RepID=A0AAE0KRK0_9CHLO|nr:hypothetical protein CYMTET_32818 [Cymbomonas tetramitiformis]|eukprot:gene10537-12467_t